MGSKILKKLSAWLPVVLWASMIFHFSSGTIPVASKIFWQDFAIKKMGHVFLFGFLALLVYRGLRMEGVERKKAAILAVVLTFLYGASDEYHQMSTQGREPRLRDVFIDGVGAGLIILTTYCLPSKLSKDIYSFIEKLNLT